LLFAIVPPTTAFAATQINYASGVNGTGGQYHTTNPDFATRNYNQVWHQAGKEWEVWYYANPNDFCVVDNTNNPTKCPNEFVTVEADAANITDNSGVTWTAQTTVP
jgi:hypothetical protein